MTLTDAILVDFEVDEEEIAFGIKGKDEEFWTALDEFKSAIPPRQRLYDPEHKLWTVKNTPENREALERIFKNAKSCFLTAEAQMMLF